MATPAIPRSAIACSAAALHACRSSRTPLATKHTVPYGVDTLWYQRRSDMPNSGRGVRSATAIPWCWGATAAEADADYPCDGLIARPELRLHRAIGDSGQRQHRLSVGMPAKGCPVQLRPDRQPGPAQPAHAHARSGAPGDRPALDGLQHLRLRAGRARHRAGAARTRARLRADGSYLRQSGSIGLILQARRAADHRGGDGTAADRADRARLGSPGHDAQAASDDQAAGRADASVQLPWLAVRPLRAGTASVTGIPRRTR